MVWNKLIVTGGAILGRSINGINVYRYTAVEKTINTLRKVYSGDLWAWDNFEKREDGNEDLGERGSSLICLQRDNERSRSTIRRAQ